MHRRILSLVLIGFLSIIIINWSCTKIDTTNLGSDLIPAVDNVNTFADTFYITAIQHDYTDTTIVANSDDHVLGKITNNPLFGNTEAKIFLQLKPDHFPFAFGQADSIAGGLDSVVLCLAYKGSYGDSSIPQTLQVNEISDNTFRNNPDADHPTTYQPSAIGNLVGSKLVDMRVLQNYIVYNNKVDSVNNQIRIKLDPILFAKDLFESDSLSLIHAGNHRFLNDSIYQNRFLGLAITSVGGGNALMYINIADTNTKLEVHYKMKVAGGIDTLYKSLKLVQATDTATGSVFNVFRSVTANYIHHDHTGSISNPAPDELYLQGQPGTYAELKIPQLTGYTNRIVHRAEIIIEGIPDVISNPDLTPPNFLYLDLLDSATTTPKYKPLYYDLNNSVFYDPDYKLSTIYYPTGGPDFSYFGGFKRTKTGPAGESMPYYNINVTRYIQHMVTDQSRNYDMRLWPAFKFVYPQYSTQAIPYNNSVGYGQIRVGNGNNPNYRMRIRIVYSKIK